MGLVQGREDGQHGDSLAGGRTSPGMEASVSQDLFPFFNLCFLFTHMFPSCPSRQPTETRERDLFLYQKGRNRG